MNRCFLFTCMLLFIITTSSLGQAAEDLARFNKERIAINKTGMAVLTAWSVANIVSGGIGYATAGEGEARYFHQMNGMWGIINAAIGGLGLIDAIRDKKEYNFKQTLRQQHGHEKIFLFNAALDAVYITAGYALIQNSKSDFRRSDRYRGWGHSIIIQGAGLLIFDAVMFVSHNRHAKRKLSPLIQRATFSVNENGIGLRYRF